MRTERSARWLSAGFVTWALTACAGAPVAAPSASWQLLAAPTRASLRGIAAVDADTAWVTGSAGTVLRTRDAGRSWQSVPPPGCATCDFRDVVAFDVDTALVMVAGAPAQVWRTEDGGGSWRLVFADPAPEAFFDAIAAHGDHLVLFGDPVGEGLYVAESFDGGRSFARTARSQLPEPLPGEAGFAASGTCVHAFGAGDFGIVTGGGGVRFLRRQSSKCWAAALPLAAGAPSRGAFSVAFDGAGRRGVAVGGDYEHPDRNDGVAAVTEDGGQTWSPPLRSPDGYRSAVLWLGGGVLAAGPTGCSWSGDGGETWAPFGNVGLHCLAAADGVVWGAGADGRVARLVLVPGR